MKTKSKISIILIFLILASMSGFSQVTADYDKSVDFTKFKTYSFAGWQKNSDKLLNDLDKKRLLDAFAAEFKSRGLTLVKDNADLIVTLFLVIDNKTSTTAYTNYTGTVGMRAGYGWGMGVGGVGMGSSTTTYSENDYQEGTLVADAYDSSTKKLLWQGVSQSVIQKNASKRDKTIPKRVSKLMKKYPVDPAK